MLGMTDATSILAIETSCDETAIAILRGDREFGVELLASEVASQIAEHERFGGVVPEVASRNHLAQLPRLLERAIASARIQIDQIDAFAATSGPGLASSLLVGNSVAKGLAIGTGKPFLPINHLEGHLLSPFFSRQHAGHLFAMPGETRVLPHVALVVSGGHTLLVHVRGVGDYELLGRTVDDAAGEAFDKVAKLLGLGYPGGPEIETHAKNGDATKFDLPRSMLNSGDLNFSFSGLKTAVRYLLPKVIPSENASPARTEGSRHESFKVTHRDPSPPSHKATAWQATDARDDGIVNDVCASFQQAVIDVLREKSLRALRQTGSRCLTLSGGVSCNRSLRENLGAACEKNGIEFLVAEPWLCTDNAAMIAFAAMLRMKTGFRSELTEEIDPNLKLVS
jgi:N6-L-threonylcarbamoyladenine synthase